MTLVVCDVNGYVGEFTPIHWYNALIEWADEFGGEVLKELIQTGMTERVQELEKELESTKFPDDLREVAMLLLDNVAKCDSVVIITGA